MTQVQLERRKERVEWVDMAKGIAMLLVIVGHTDFSIVRHFIYGFHMPLFFILSGYTYRCSTSNNDFKRKTKKAFRHLFIPGAVLVVLSQLLHFFIQDYDGTVQQYLLQSVKSLLFFSGVEAKFMGVSIDGVGAAWFFMSFFFARTLFDYLHLKLGECQRMVLVAVLTLIGVTIVKFTWLPLSFDTSLAALIFIEAGHQLSKNANYSKPSYKRLAFNATVYWGG